MLAFTFYSLSDLRNNSYYTYSDLHIIDIFYLFTYVLPTLKITSFSYLINKTKKQRINPKKSKHASSENVMKSYLC